MVLVIFESHIDSRKPVRETNRYDIDWIAAEVGGHLAPISSWLDDFWAVLRKHYIPRTDCGKAHARSPIRIRFKSVGMW